MPAPPARCGAPIRSAISAARRSPGGIVRRACQRAAEMRCPHPGVDRADPRRFDETPSPSPQSLELRVASVNSARKAIWRSRTSASGRRPSRSAHTPFSVPPPGSARELPDREPDRRPAPPARKSSASSPNLRRLRVKTALEFSPRRRSPPSPCGLQRVRCAPDPRAAPPRRPSASPR